MATKKKTAKRKALLKKRRRQRRFRIFLLCAGIVLFVSLSGYLVYEVYHMICPADNTTQDFAKQGNVRDKNNIGVVVLDPGHGGYDGGAEGVNGVLEKDVTLKIALLMKQQLESQHVTVVLTRDSDEVSWPSVEISDLTARTNISNESGGDLFVSLHTNSSEVMNDGSNGTEIWTMMINNANISLANHLEKQLETLNYTQNRGVKDESERPLAVLKKNYLPAVLVEMGFLSDTEDCSYLSSADGQKAIAKALSQGIIETLKENKK